MIRRRLVWNLTRYQKVQRLWRHRINDANPSTKDVTSKHTMQTETNTTPHRSHRNFKKTQHCDAFRTRFPYKARLKLWQTCYNAVLLLHGVRSTTSHKFLPNSLWMTLVTREREHFRRTLFMKKLKRSHDKASTCLKPHTVSKDSEWTITTLMELQHLPNVILISSSIYRTETLRQKHDPFWGYCLIHT